MIALFDFDGVVMDTEDLYTRFWKSLGNKYFKADNFGSAVKGQTLKQIFGQYVPDLNMQREIEEALDRFEHDMPFEYVKGADKFLKELKEAGIPTAIVTSSTMKKMENVFRSFPDFPDTVDMILTAECFTKSKPDPECFLIGMERLGGTPENTFIFEDSFNGLKAAGASGGIVVGIATTNSRESIMPLADHVLDDFTGLSCQVLDNWLNAR